MKAAHKITVEIPDEFFREISDFKKREHIKDDKTAVFELIKYALTLPSYFSRFDWKKAEEEAEADIAAGNMKSFSSVDDFLADLRA